MELRHLRYFIAVAEELHFARAATRLGIEQSPLSRQIRDLEEEIGVSLFARTTRSTRLTFAGGVFLRDARHILANVDIATHSAREAASGRNGRLSLSIADGLASLHVSRLLVAIRAELPGLELRPLDLPGTHQFAALRSGQLDVALCMREADGPDLQTQTLWTEALAVALPLSHALACQPRIDISQLRNEPIAMCHPDLGSGCYGQLMAAFREVGIEPQVAEYVSQRATMLMLVAAGFGLGIATMGLEAGTPVGVVLRPLTGPKTELTIYGAWRTDDTSHAVKTVLDLARSLG